MPSFYLQLEEGHALLASDPHLSQSLKPSLQSKFCLKCKVTLIDVSSNIRQQLFLSFIFSKGSCCAWNTFSALTRGYCKHLVFLVLGGVWPDGGHWIISCGARPQIWCCVGPGISFHSHIVFLRIVRRLLVTANVVPSSLIHVTLMM
jgi:hypothetical protein